MEAEHVTIPSAEWSWQTLVAPKAKDMRNAGIARRLALYLAAYVDGVEVGPTAGHTHVEDLLDSMLSDRARDQLERAVESMRVGMLRLYGAFESRLTYGRPVSRTNRPAGPRVVEALWPTFRDKARFARWLFGHAQITLAEFAQYVHVYMGSGDVPPLEAHDMLVRIDTRLPSHLVLTHGVLSEAKGRVVPAHAVVPREDIERMGLASVVQSLARINHIVHIVDVTGLRMPLRSRHAPFSTVYFTGDSFAAAAFEDETVQGSTEAWTAESDEEARNALPPLSRFL